MYKKVLGVVVLITTVLLLTGCGSTYNSRSIEPTNNNQEETNVEEKTETKTSYYDALRKCTVMEAADLYTTGGQKSNNVFNDARETCESWHRQWGEKDFIEAAEADWNNRQNEEIDGQPLSYYLGILGW